MTAVLSSLSALAQSPSSFEPTSESLKQAEIPEWFIDGQNTTFEEMQVIAGK